MVISLSSYNELLLIEYFKDLRNLSIQYKNFKDFISINGKVCDIFLCIMYI